MKNLNQTAVDSHWNGSSSHAVENKQLIQLAQTIGTPLFVIDESQLKLQYEKLQTALPDVKLFYAIKALADKNVISSLNRWGSHFDIATSGEIDLLREVGVSADSCIHTHPIKKLEDIEYSLDFGCNTFVVDNVSELKKFISYKDSAKIIVRVKFNNSSAVVDLSKKFGCEISEIDELLQVALEEGINIVGLSFHIGSQTIFPTAHAEAIKSCLSVMRKHIQIDWQILDIGGGFPIEYDSSVLSVYNYCEPIRQTLKLVPHHIHVIAEPGRYIVGPVAKHIVTVVGKAKRDERNWYYLDDGVYGAFSGQLYDHAKYPVSVLQSVKKSDNLRPSVIAGPTCDSIDVIDDEILLPELEIGDTLVVGQIGAYSMASSTNFNLCKRPKTHFLRNK